MTRAALHFDVIFVEEPIFGPWAAELRCETVGGVRLAVPYLPQGLSDQARDDAIEGLITTLLGSFGRSSILWYYTPAAVAFSRRVPRALTIYDNMDELSAFRGASPDLLRFEHELLEQADQVFSGGRSLYEAKRSRHDSVHLFPSSVDVTHFCQARNSELPDPFDQSDIAHPRLGFFGVIDERMDLNFVADLATLRPDWHLVMLGPVVKIDPADLPRRSNIHWLGPKHYDELPAYLAHWDLGIMPFALNEATRFISPTKTPEYLAGGLRVISTPIADVVRAYGGDESLVAIAETPADAAAQAETLLQEPSATWLARVDARLATESWDQTWQAMLDIIHTALRRNAEDPEPSEAGTLM